MGGVGGVGVLTRGNGGVILGGLLLLALVGWRLAWALGGRRFSVGILGWAARRFLRRGTGWPRKEVRADVAGGIRQGRNGEVHFSTRHLSGSDWAGPKENRQSMNTIVGKSAGIALLLAAGLMLALFAMGVFSSNRASADADALVVTLTNGVPGKAVKITITTKGTVGQPGAPPVATNVLSTDIVAPGEEITVELPKFVIPSSISEKQVEISSTVISGSESTTGYIGNPSEVRIDGQKLHLTIPVIQTSGANKGASGLYTIVIKQGAGIKNPLRASDSDDDAQDVKVTFNEKVDNGAFTPDIERTIEVSKASAARGTEITITGRGFDDGSAEVYTAVNATSTARDQSFSKDVGEPEVTDGVFELVVNNNLKDNSNADVFPRGDGVYISAADGSGNEAQVLVKHKINPSLTFSSSSVSPGEMLTITVKDAANGEPTDVKFASTSVNADCAGYGGAAVTPPTVADPDCGITAFLEQNDTRDKSFKVQVPSGLRLGSIRVLATIQPTGDPAPALVNVNKNISIVAKELTLSPTTAVQGQEVTVQGSGFGGGLAVNVTVDNKGREASGVTTVQPFTGVADTGGNVSITIKVPNAVKSGDRTVKVTDSSGRVGQATLTVSKAALTIDPKESLRGSLVTVTGTGFPANGLIQLSYQRFVGSTASDQPLTTVSTDSTGNFQDIITVPSYARIGMTQKIVANPQLNTDADSAEAEHSTPKPAITLEPSSTQAGELITISGMNYAGFINIAEMKINNLSVIPSPAPSTSGTGMFTTANIRVPQLDPGRYTVSVKVGSGTDEQTTTAFLEVIAAPPDQPPAVTFGDVGENLVVVWRYNNEDSSWASYDPDAPADLNDLAIVGSGDIVWVQVNEQQMFQGRTLYAGWNLITLR